jgi:hypothetical protein
MIAFDDAITIIILGFFTGLGSTFGIELSHYMIEKIRQNGKALKELGKQS